MHVYVHTRKCTKIHRYINSYSIVYKYLSTYIYIYIYMCVCVCVRARAQAREFPGEQSMTKEENTKKEGLFDFS